MNVNYLDPSAWVKRYFAEIGSDAVARIFEDPSPISCTRFGLVEVAATISRKGAAENFSSEMVASMLAQAGEDFAAFSQSAITDELLIDAETLAFKHRLRAGDANHLASAMMLMRIEGVTSVTMISADNELLSAASNELLLTFNPNSTV